MITKCSIITCPAISHLLCFHYFMVLYRSRTKDNRQRDDFRKALIAQLPTLFNFTLTTNIDTPCSDSVNFAVNEFT